MIFLMLSDKEELTWSFVDMWEELIVLNDPVSVPLKF